MRRRHKFILRAAAWLLALAAAGAGAVYLGGGPLLKARFLRVVPHVYGTPLHLARLDINPFRVAVRVTDLRVDSPPGFAPGPMLTVPSLYVNVDPWRSLWRGRWCVQMLDLEVGEIVYERHADGTSNWDTWLGGPTELPAAFPEELPGPADTGPEIERLRFSLGRVQLAGDGLPLGGGMRADFAVQGREYRDVAGTQGLYRAAAGELTRAWLDGSLQMTPLPEPASSDMHSPGDIGP
jgi:hypothetical protein